MIIYVDIDGTICTLNSLDASNTSINNYVAYWTARGTVTNIDWIDLTRQQLYDWGCKCHDVRVKKPQYDLWIDDKSMRIEEV